MKQPLRTLALALLTLLVVPLESPAQSAALITDLQIGHDDGGSYPRGFTYFAGEVFFTATRPTYGFELWRTDGTAAGTRLVADLCPGPCSSLAVAVAATETHLFFRARHAVFGEELWSLSTEGELALLGDLCPGPCGGLGGEAGVLGNRLFFAATDGASGMELWVSDGSRAGTRRVRDICPGPCAAAPAGLTEFEGRLYFAAEDGTTGRELWRTDGTAAGTVLVADLCPDCDGDPQGLTVAEGALHFGADDGEVGREPWRTDGTAGGTRRLADLIPGPAGSNPQEIFSALGKTYVQGDCEEKGFCTWKRTGSFWVPATELYPLGTNTRPVEMLEEAGELFFSLGPRSGVGFQLWVTRGTSGSTRQVLDAVSNLGALTASSGGVLFRATVLRDGEFLRTLWFSEGTPRGTVPFEQDIEPGSFSPREMVATPLGIFFQAQRKFSKAEPWVTDGNPEDTRELLDLGSGAASSNPVPRFDLNRRLLLQTGIFREGVWSTDGTEAGTENLSGSVDAFVRVGDEAFFLDSIGSTLNVTDGTPDGTRQLVAFPSSGRTRSLAALDPDGPSPRLLFGDNGPGQRLWSYDPRTGGQTLVADLNPTGWTNEPCVFSPCPIAGFFPNVLTATESGTFFLGSEEETPIQLWFAEGTGGTVEVRRLHTFNTGVVLRYLFPEVPTVAFAPRDFVPFRGGVLFAAFETDSGFEPWVSDGTVAGTLSLGDLVPGAVGSDPYGFTVVPGESGADPVPFAYFFTRGPEGGELWRTDGTAVGTRRITALSHDGEPAFAAQGAGRSVVQDGTFYFTAATVETGDELWVSDGTAQGTHLLGEIHPGTRGAGIGSLTALAVRGRSALLFAADDGVHGHEMWTLRDGEPRLVQDIAPGPEPSSPADFVAVGSRVYFGADDGEHGRELWSLPFAVLTLPVDLPPVDLPPTRRP
jgi:ELWxxDGT repeat protein